MQSAGTTSLECPLILSAPFPVSSLPPVMGVRPQYSGGYRRKMGFSNCVLHNWGSWTLAHHCPFPPQEGSPQASSALLCAAWVVLAKFLLPFPACLNLPSSPIGLLESFLEQLGLLQRLSHQWCLPKLALSRIFPSAAEEGWGPSFTPAGYTASLKVCLPLTQCTGG